MNFFTCFQIGLLGNLADFCIVSFALMKKKILPNNKNATYISLTEKKNVKSLKHLICEAPCSFCG